MSDYETLFPATLLTGLLFSEAQAGGVSQIHTFASLKKGLPRGASAALVLSK